MNAPLTVMACFFTALRRGAVLLVALSLARVAWGQAPSHSAGPGTPRFLNTAPGVGYVGSDTCKMCHFDVSQSFRRTAMGRSMALPGDPEQLARVPQPVTVHSEEFKATFEVARQGTDLVQSEYQLDAQGKEVFRNTRKIAYVIGAGENGVGYIVRWGDYLVEAPLSYYARTGTWELSPGYEFHDFGFARPMTASCIACHAGRPEPAPAGHGLYRDPPFSEAAIGCETCHGPGQLHVAARMKGTRLAGKVDPMIVNPAHLPGWLADNICMRCHQTGDARILKPGKTYGDFRPGTPLDHTVSLFLVPFSRTSPPQDPLLQQYISMHLSRCYRASGGKMHCITCHDPHVEPAAAEAPEYFRHKCLQCHTESSCKLTLQARQARTPPDDCAGCHMPKQNVAMISHSALTNHRIVTSVDEPFPEATYHLTNAPLPDLIHLDAIPGGQAAPISPLVLLQAYGEVKGTRPEYEARYSATLARAARTNPRDPYVLAALGRKKAAENTPQAKAQAIQLLSQAIQAGWSETPDYALLSGLLAEAGRAQEGVDVLQHGIEVNPFDGGLYRMLVVQLVQLQKYDDALAVIKRDLALFPQDSFMRGLLRRAETPPGP